MKTPAKTQADLRREEYIKIAAKLIAENGFERTSTREIADKIGLSTGNMFHHFSSKNDLLEAIIRTGLNNGLEFMKGSVVDTDGPLQRLYRGVRVHLEILHGQLGDFHKVWYQEWSKLEPKSRTELGAMNREYRAMWDDTLSVLARHGYLKSDPGIARHMLLPALNWTVFWVDPATDSLDDVAYGVCATLLNMATAEMRKLCPAELCENQPQLR